MVGAETAMMGGSGGGDETKASSPPPPVPVVVVAAAVVEVELAATMANTGPPLPTCQWEGVGDRVLEVNERWRESQTYVI